MVGEDGPEEGDYHDAEESLGRTAGGNCGDHRVEKPYAGEFEGSLVRNATA